MFVRFQGEAGNDIISFSIIYDYMGRLLELRVWHVF